VRQIQLTGLLLFAIVTVAATAVRADDSDTALAAADALLLQAQTAADPHPVIEEARTIVLDALPGIPGFAAICAARGEAFMVKAEESSNPAEQLNKILDARAQLVFARALLTLP